MFFVVFTYTSHFEQVLDAGVAASIALGISLKVFMVIPVALAIAINFRVLCVASKRKRQLQAIQMDVDVETNCTPTAVFGGQRAQDRFYHPCHQHRIPGHLATRRRLLLTHQS